MNVEVRAIKTSAEQALAAAYAAARGTLPGKGAVAKLREAAFARFDAAGLPHRRVEEWKYTDLRALMREAYPLAAPPDAAAKARAKKAASILAGVDCRRLTFVDGAFAPDLSDLSPEPGLTIGGMADALAKGDPQVSQVGKVFETADAAVALNTALMGDGAVIRVADGAVIKRPIHLVFAAGSDKPSAAFLRSLIVVGKGARVTLIEEHDSGSNQVNAALELVVGDEAEVDYFKITQAQGLHVASLLASVGAKAKFNTFAFTCNSSVVRNQMLHPLCRRRHPCRHSRRFPVARQGACRHHAADRPRQGPLREPRAVPLGARRRKPRRVPGQDRGRAARAEDRRQDDDARAAAVG